MKSKIIIAIVLVLVVFAALAGVKTLQIKSLIAAGAAYVPPPESIASAVAHPEKWQETLDAIGSIAAQQGVTVTPEIGGTVGEIAFESGATVAKGDLLVRLDTSSEEAQLRSIEAQWEWARVSAERMRKLKADNTVSQSELDNAESTLKQFQASADTIRAAIEKKTIRAPFAGRLGIRLVNLGEYLETGKPIVSLQALGQVYVDFSLPQQELAKLKTGAVVRVSMDTYTNRFFDGTLSAINPDLDHTTRSIGLRATLDNPGELLRPGMFARVQVLLPGDQEVLVIPATAVLSAPFGDSVYLIHSSTNAAGGLVVQQQFIRTGRARGDFISVESGLKPGDKIAAAGLFKLRNGAAVVEENNLSPKPAESPRLGNS